MNVMDMTDTPDAPPPDLVLTPDGIHVMTATNQVEGHPDEGKTALFLMPQVKGQPLIAFVFSLEMLDSVVDAMTQLRSQVTLSASVTSKVVGDTPETLQ